MSYNSKTNHIRCIFLKTVIKYIFMSLNVKHNTSTFPTLPTYILRGSVKVYPLQDYAKRFFPLSFKNSLLSHAFCFPLKEVDCKQFVN